MELEDEVRNSLVVDNRSPDSDVTLIVWKELGMLNWVVHVPKEIDHDSKLAKHTGLDVSRELLASGAINDHLNIVSIIFLAL